MSKTIVKQRNCKVCNILIPHETYKKHRNINNLLSDLRIDSKGFDFRDYCIDCASGYLGMIEAVSDDQWRYNWIGSKVKLNVKRIFGKRRNTNMEFMQFVNENVHKTLTLKLYEKEGIEFDKSLASGQYKFEEIDDDEEWVFHISDLNIEQDNRKLHMKKET